MRKSSEPPWSWDVDHEPQGGPDIPRMNPTQGGCLMDLVALSGGAATVLWLIAAVLVIAGIVTAIRGGVMAGIVLVVIGLLVGPGGVSIFK